VFSDLSLPPRVVPEEPAAQPSPVPAEAPPPAGPQPVRAHPEAAPEAPEPAARRIGLSDLLGAGLLLPQDVLMVEGTEGRRQTATITPDGKINVAGQVFDAVSPAALRALELAGKPRKTVNGWAAFRVLRAGSYIGTLIEVRGQYEDREQEGAAAGPAQDLGAAAPAGPDPAVLAAVDQLKPLLALLPELTAHPSKSGVSLYAGKLVVAYAYPRKRGLPRLRAYVGETCADWVTADPTYASWCYIDDWDANLERVVALLKEAPRRRAEDMTAGRDAYCRRAQLPGMGSAVSAE
jgi:Restriction Enzyme Adenine Methylase Associated